jgi:aspartyl aminopeptidase
MKKEEYMINVKSFFDFMNESITPYHAVKNVEEILLQNGFIELFENEVWKLDANKKYYVKRDDTSIIAFYGNNPINPSCHIIASHCDSPCLMIKPKPILSRPGYVRLNVETYGGMIMSTWFDKPLGIAGRVIVETSNNTIETKLVKLSKSVVIPNVAIHFNRTINTSFAINPQVDLLPLLGSNENKFNEELENEVDHQKIVSYDLFLYNKEEAGFAGLEDEYITSSRIDDLECVYTSLCGFIENVSKSNNTNILAIFNNEEVGSLSMAGADSTLLGDVIHRISDSYSLDYIRLLNNSMILSADNAHAVHPAHPEYTDDVNAVYMNKGLVIKRQAGLRYTTNARSEGILRFLLDSEKIPYQLFTNRSNILGGSTLGAINQRHLSILSCDVGLAQLAMHSSLETAGSKDIEYAISAFSKFYNTSFIIRNSKVEFSK